MYGLYQVEEISNQLHLRFKSETHLAGCNVGLIPGNLRNVLPTEAEVPYLWELNIEEIYRTRDEVVIIDFKPSSKKVVLMGELTHVFGYSYPGVDNPWTPILLRIKLIADINDPNIAISYDKKLMLYENSGFVYTMGHLTGSVHHGKLVGLWNPGWGSLNSVLLWPDALAYFFQCVKKTDPDFLI